MSQIAPEMVDWWSWALSWNDNRKLGNSAATVQPIGFTCELFGYRFADLHRDVLRRYFRFWVGGGKNAAWVRAYQEVWYRIKSRVDRSSAFVSEIFGDATYVIVLHVLSLLPMIPYKVRADLHPSRGLPRTLSR
jgi:hypothetical protein